MKTRFSLWLAVYLLSAAVAPAVFAQTGDAAEETEPAAEEVPASEDDALDAAIDAAAEEPAAASDAPASETAEAVDEAAAEDVDLEEAEDPLENLEPDDKLYWSTLRDVYTLQQRRFQKSGRFGITLYAGLIPNNIFEQYYPVGLRLSYFILENIGVELAGSYNIKSSTSLEPLIREESGVGAGQVLIGDTQVSHTNFGIVWSPFYGKGAFYNSGLVHFDLFLFAGAGVVVAETTPNFNQDPEQEIKPEGALGGGLAMFLGGHFAARADFRQFVFPKVNPPGGVANPSEVSLGVSYFF